MTMNSNSVDASSSEEPLPRPSLWLVLHSLVLIGAALWFVSATLGFILAPTHECEKIAFGILAAPVVLFALVQYLGTFRRRASNVLLVALVQSFAAVVALLVAVSFWGHFSLPGVIISFAVGLFCIFGVQLNFFWRDRLLDTAARSADLSCKYQFTLLETMALTATVCAMLANAIYTIRSVPPIVADHVDAASVPLTLPKGASDVSYCRYFRSGFEAEFQVEEQDLIDWLPNDSFPYHEEAPDREFTEIVTPETTTRADEFSGPNEVAVKNGLLSGYSNGAGCGYRVIYDRDTKRAYYRFYVD